MRRSKPGARELVTAARWALRSTLGAAPRLSAVLVGSSLAASLVTPLLALSLGSFVGALRGLDTAAPDLPSRPLQLLGLVLLLVLFQVITGALREHAQQRLGEEVELTLSLRILRHAARLDLAFYEDPDSRDLVALASRNPGRHFVTFLTGVVNALAALLESLLLLAVLLWIEPWVTPLLIVVTLPFFVLRWRLAEDRFEIERLKTRKKRWSNYFFSRFTTQGATSATKILDLPEWLSQRFEATWRDIMTTTRRLYRKQATVRILGAVGYLTGLVIAAGWVGLQALRGVLSLAQAATYGLAAFRLRASLDALGGAVAGALGSSLFVSHLRHFLASQPAVGDPSTALPCRAGGTIELEGLTFTYPGANRPALDGVSARIASGETIALVGANGSGKTTLVKLLARLYEPTSGSIRIDGTDLRDIAGRDFHDQIAVVFQHAVRFEASARDNIAYGRWRDLMDDPTAVRSAASDAGLDDLIASLPDGEDTHLGRMFGKVELSAGQWKRIEIARALARKPALLILDEPAAAFDPRAVHEVFDALRAQRPKPTILFVSHRMALARLADRVLVLDQGRLVEEGTHDDLLARAGLYAEMFDLQRQEAAIV